MADSLLAQAIGKRSEFYKSALTVARAMLEGQRPTALVIGCCDSRVIPEAIMGAGPGEVFVSRVIANIVPPPGTADAAVMGSALEFAVTHLKVGHLVICGHTHCGGLAALVSGVSAHDDPHLARWLEYARPAQTRVEAQAIFGEDEAARLDQIVEENVRLQLAHVQEYEVVRRAAGSGALELHGWVYELETGQVRYYEPVVDSFLLAAS